MKAVALFPGQGAQEVGMGKALAEAHDAARAVFERGRAVLAEGDAVLRAMWEGPEEELTRTDRTQPALFLHSAAAWEVWRAGGGDSPSEPPVLVAAAGHSVGEFAALYAAGALSFEDALRLVETRAAAMQEAAERNPGGMLAVIGLDPDAARAVCEEASSAGVCVPANDNCPGQIVLSGEKAALARAADLAQARGARRVVPLAVAGAWHSPLMESAAKRLARAIAEVEVRPPRVPVYSNVTARPYESADEIRRLLVEQVVSPVRFREILEALAGGGGAADGAFFVELGTGRVLCGLLRRVARRPPAFHFG